MNYTYSAWGALEASRDVSKFDQESLLDFNERQFLCEALKKISSRGTHTRDR